MSAPTSAFGAPGSEPLADARVHAVDGGARGAQLGELGGVLAHPQLAQHGPGELLLARSSVAEAQQVQGRRHVGDGDRTDRHPAEGEGVRVLTVDPRAHLDAELAQRHVPETGELELGRDEGRAPRRRRSARPGP